VVIAVAVGVRTPDETQALVLVFVAEKEGTLKEERDVAVMEERDVVVVVERVAFEVVEDVFEVEVEVRAVVVVIERDFVDVREPVNVKDNEDGTLVLSIRNSASSSLRSSLKSNFWPFSP